MKKPAFSMCVNKGADKQFCFRKIDRTSHRLPKSEILRLYPSSMVVQPSLRRTGRKPRRQVFS